MAKKFGRSRPELEQCYNRTVDSVYRTCRMYFKDNIADIEDAVQTTYLKWLAGGEQFENERHEKAWLIVTASNICKNTLKHWWRKNTDIDGIEPIGRSDEYESESLLPLLRGLSEKQRVALYMHYYEGDSCAEIAQVLHKTETAVWGYLHERRKKLKKQLEGDRYA